MSEWLLVEIENKASAGVQAGAPYLMAKEDLKMVAPMWSTFTRKVRNDPKARLSDSLCIPLDPKGPHVL